MSPPDGDVPASEPSKGVRHPLPRSHVLQVAAAIAGILLRLWDLRLEGWWRDWTVLLCLYWIYLVLVPRRIGWKAVTLGTALALMVLYGVGHVPHVAGLRDLFR